MRYMRHGLAAGLIAAGLLGGIAGFGSASAQSVPVVPLVIPPGGGCIIVAGLAPCVPGPVPIPPIIMAGVDQGRVDVDRDVDRSRQPGTVLIR